MVEELSRIAAPSLLLLPLLFVVLLGCTELGYRLGHRRRPADDRQHSQIGTVLAALLALLGLLLAFSFQITEERFQQRKLLVIREANAIETTFLRTDFLPPAARARARTLLRRYVEIRVSPVGPEALQDTLARAELLHKELWATAVEAANGQPEAESVALFVRTLNELIDLHEERVTVALRHRLPKVILLLLCLIALLSMGVLGHSAGLGGHRTLGASAALALAIAAVIFLIVDLDRPYQRTFHIGQQAMEDVRRSLDRAPP